MVLAIVHVIGSGRMRRAGACSTDRQRRNIDRVLVGKTEGNRPSETAIGTEQQDFEINLKVCHPRCVVN